MANSALNKLKSKVNTKTLVGKQKNLDMNKNGKLDKEDFKILRGDKMAKGGKMSDDGDIPYKEIKKMTTIKVNGLNGYMPGVRNVYFDETSKKFFFKDFEGRIMEVKNGKTIEEIKKHHKFEDGGYMAKGGELIEDKMIEKLSKQFEGKDLWDDEIMDEYEVKMFDYREDDEMEKWKRKNREKNYIVPFDSEDDSYIFILVPKDKMAKGGELEGLRASIYRSDYDSPTNKLYGKKDVTVVDSQVPKIFDADKDAPAVRLVRRKLGFGDKEYEYIHAIPYDQSEHRGMFGGTFIYSSDSRFPAKYPIPLHDRVESYKDGGELDTESKEWKKKMIKNHKETVEGYKQLLYRAEKIGQSDWDIHQIKKNIQFHNQMIKEYEKELESMEKGGYMAYGGEVREKYNVSFNYNQGNLSNKDAEKIVEKYTKDWKHNNDLDEVSFYVMGLSKSDSDMLVKELKMEDTYNVEVEKSRYAKGGYMAEGGKVRNIDKIKENIGEEVFESIKHSNKEQLEKWLKENHEAIKHSLKFFGGKKTLQYYKLKDEQWLILHRLERTDEFNYDDDVDYENGGFMADGGEAKKNDLFYDYSTGDYENIPENVLVILRKYDEEFIDGDYSEIVKAKKELNKIGYTFDIDSTQGGIITENLRKIAEKGGYMADGGEVDENGYVAFYKGKKMDVYAKTSLQARDKAAKAFGAKKAYDVIVVLAEKDGKQVVHKASFADGGTLAEQNNDMLQSNIVEIKHHVDELKSIVSKNTEVEPWVIAKAERASTDLSDITHYLEGEKQKGLEMPFEKGGYMADGGSILRNKFKFDESINFKNELKSKFPNIRFKFVEQPNSIDAIQGRMVTTWWFNDGGNVQIAYYVRGEYASGEDLGVAKTAEEAVALAEKEIKDWNYIAEKGGYMAKGGETNLYSSARLLGRDSQDWENEAREYAGKEWNFLTQSEKEELIDFLKNGFDRNTHFAKGGYMASGGMTAGRYYKDNSGKEFRYIGESKGKLLFKDGEKIVEKSEDDFEDSTKETKLFGFFEEGGEIKNQYENLTPKEIWSMWTEKQRMHFIRDHKHEFPEIMDSTFILAKKDFGKLPARVQIAVEFHTEDGEYAMGGRLSTSAIERMEDLVPVGMMREFQKNGTVLRKYLKQDGFGDKDITKYLCSKITNEYSEGGEVDSEKYEAVKTINQLKSAIATNPNIETDSKVFIDGRLSNIMRLIDKAYAGLEENETVTKLYFYIDSATENIDEIQKELVSTKSQTSIESDYIAKKLEDLYDLVSNMGFNIEMENED